MQPVNRVTTNLATPLVLSSERFVKMRLVNLGHRSFFHSRLPNQTRSISRALIMNNNNLFLFPPYLVGSYKKKEHVHFRVTKSVYNVALLQCPVW